MASASVSPGSRSTRWCSTGRATGGALDAHPLETNAVGWFSEDALPEPLAGYSLWGEFAFAAIRGEHRDVFYDQPRSPVWQGSEADGDVTGG